MITKVANKPGVWYLIHIRECPVCGHTVIERERKAGPKPEVLSECYDYQQSYDYCLI